MLDTFRRPRYRAANRRSHALSESLAAGVVSRIRAAAEPRAVSAATRSKTLLFSEVPAFLVWEPPPRST
jgi:hypothetical protein